MLIRQLLVMRKPGFVPVTIIEIHESVNKMF